jgi:hypothetical protein
MSVARLKEMLERMVVVKDPATVAYTVEYDEDAWIEADGKVAGRLWITTARPGEEPNRFEVVLIATFDGDGRITRIRETTWPDWSAVEAFEDYD